MSDNSQETEGKKILLETKIPRDLPFKPRGPGPAKGKMKKNSKRKMPEQPEAEEKQKQ